MWPPTCRRCREALLVGVLTVSASCAGEQPEAPRTAPPTSSQTTAGTGHEQHTPPHGGTLVELGDEIGQVEFVRDRGEGRLTAYVLDGEAEQSVRLTQPTIVIRLRDSAASGASFTLQPHPSALTGERVGDASEFALTDARFKNPGPMVGVIAEIIFKGQTFHDVAFLIPAD